MSFANRGWTYTQLSAFEDADVERYRFDAVLDEVTSHACRFIAGREFRVARAIQRFDDVENASHPKAIAELQPWMRVGADGAGNQVLSTSAAVAGGWSRRSTNQPLESATASAGIRVPVERSTRSRWPDGTAARSRGWST
jgi:hypothetical protein